MRTSKRNHAAAAMAIGLVILTACGLLNRVPGRVGPVAVDPTQTAAVSPVPTRGPDVSGQSAAMLESFQAELADLDALPFYELTVDVDPEGAAFEGELRLTYTNLEDNALPELFFRLLPNGGKSYGGGSLRVSQAAEAGNELTVQRSVAESVLEVQLTEPVLPGGSIVLTMDFAGQIPRDFQGGGYGIYNITDRVLVMSGWFPILAVYDDEGWNLDPVSGIGDSVYSDAAYFDVQVNGPEEWEWIATGSSVVENQAGYRRFVSGPVRDFLLVAGTEYQSASGEYRGVQVTSYYLPGAEAGGKRALEVTGESLEVFTDSFGRYPYEELDVVGIPMRYAAGVEFPGVSLIAEDLYDSPGSSWFATVAAHEAAHQWWYNLVGSDVFDEPWLDEALTTFSSVLYFEAAFGEPVYRQMLEYYRESYRSAAGDGSDHPVTSSLAYFEDDPSRRGLYSPIVYSKGAVFFQELREAIGDQPFFRALQRYYRDNRYQIGTPEELLGAFESEAGRELDSLYREWLDTPGP